jgi:hypothetical protein
MFPFRDHNPSGRTPFVTYALIVLNVLIFLTYWAELDNAWYMNALLTNWAMVPEFISQGYGQAGLLTSYIPTWRRHASAWEYAVSLHFW